MASFIEVYKPTLKYENISDITQDLKQSFLSTTEYTPPKYNFNTIPSATGSVYAENDHIKCSVAIYGPQPYISNTFSEQGVVLCNIFYAPYAANHLDHIQRPKFAQVKGTRELDMANIIQDVLSSTIQLQTIQKHQITIAVTVYQQSTSQQYDLSFILNAISLTLATTGIALFDMLVSTTLFYTPAQKSKSADKLLFSADPAKRQHLSVYPQTPLLTNIIKQNNIPALPTTSLTISYLPSLNQIIYSKLVGVLPPTATSLIVNQPSGPNQWAVLTNTALEHTMLIRNAFKIILKHYVKSVLLSRLKNEQQQQEEEDVGKPE